MIIKQLSVPLGIPATLCDLARISYCYVSRLLDCIITIICFVPVVLPNSKADLHKNGIVHEIVIIS